MNILSNYQTVRLSRETKTQLEKLGHKGETFDDIVKRVLKE